MSNVVVVRIVSDLSRSDINKWVGKPGGYSYFSHIADLQPGDLVAVPVGSAKSPFFEGRFARVVEIAVTGEEAAKATRWIIDKINTEKFDALSTLDPVGNHV